MPKRSPSNAEFLILLPWWISVALAAISYIGLAFIVPAIATEDLMLVAVQDGISTFVAPFTALLLLVLAGISALRSRQTRTLLNEQTGLASLCDLPWKDFEDLIAEVYRRQEYRVEESLGAGADGGIDLVLRKNGEKILVQCKRWKSKSVGAPILRELFGLMNAEKATAGTLVTTSTFTRDAKAFARGKPINLIEGTRLLMLVNEAQEAAKACRVSNEKEQPTSANPITSPIPTTKAPTCPRCAKSMVLRTARRGDSQGQEFWGCSNYPRCRETVKLAQAAG